MTRKWYVVMSVVGGCAVAPLALAQEQLWADQFGTSEDDAVWDVAPDGAGGVILGGFTSGQLGDENPAAEDVFLGRFTADGVQLWMEQFGSNGIETLNNLSADGEGGVFMAGWTTGDLGGPYQGGDRDGWFARYDADGDQLWVKQLGTPEIDYAWSVAADGAGGFYLTGWTEGDLYARNLGEDDAFIARYDGDGELIWCKQFGTEGGDKGRGVASDGAVGVFVSGSTHGDLGGANQGESDAFIAHFDADGNQIGDIVQFGSPGREVARHLAADGEGGVFTCGDTEGDLAGVNQGQADGWVARFDSSLTQLWMHQIGTSGWDRFQDVLADGNGGVWVTAATDGDLGGRFAGGFGDAVILRGDERGVVWIEQLGTDGWDEPAGLATDGVGGVFLGGFTEGSLFGEHQGSADAFVAHYGCPGDFNGDWTVGADDLITLLGAWGKNPGHLADLDGDGNVGTSDLIILLGNWGPCA